jgi:hypothetical protein
VTTYPVLRTLSLLLPFIGIAAAAPRLPMHRVALMQAGGSCVSGIQPESLGLLQAGENFVVSVIAPPTCAWTIETSVPWLATNISGGTGSALVHFTSAPNPGVTRIGFLNFSGQGIIVTQAGAGATVCTITLNPATLLTPPIGQAAVLVLGAGHQLCEWTTVSYASWIQLFPVTGTGNSVLQYTVYPNFSTLPRSGSANVGGRLFKVDQLGATATLNERFVSMMYFNFFGRLPGTAELAHQVNALAAGLSRTDFVMGFFNAPEFNLGGRFIAGLYVGVLNRDAEFGGWLFQRNALATGGEASTFVANFVNSQEFGLRFGSPTADEFVRLMYRNILLREPSDAEVAFQVAALTGGLTRVKLAQNFLDSTEFRLGTGPRLTAFLLHAVLLGRDAAPAELTFRISQLQGGVPLRTLVDQFVSGGEFLAQLQ